MRTMIFILVLGVLAGACATPLRSAPAEPVADTDSARLAAMLATELDRRSRTASGSLERAQGEMRALEAALFPAPSDAGPVQVLPSEVSEGAVSLSPDEMAGARSLYHAIHIASYRDMETARDGWRTLQVMFPEVLNELSGRIEPVDIEGQGHFLRLKAGPFLSSEAASAACTPFRAASVWCAPVDFTGEAVDAAVVE